MTPNEPRLISEHKSIDGRVCIYRRHDRVTLFWESEKNTGAVHFRVETAEAVGKSLIEAADTTTYDESDEVPTDAIEVSA